MPLFSLLTYISTRWTEGISRQSSALLYDGASQWDQPILLRGRRQYCFLSRPERQPPVDGATMSISVFSFFFLFLVSSFCYDVDKSWTTWWLFIHLNKNKFWFFSTSSSWKFNECLKRGSIAAAAFAAKSITWRQVHYHRCIIKAFTLTSYRIYIFFPFYLCPSFPKVGGTPLYETTFSCALALSPFTFFFYFPLWNGRIDQRTAGGKENMKQGCTY